MQLTDCLRACTFTFSITLQVSVPVPSHPPAAAAAASAVGGPAALKDYADHCSSADSGVSSVSAAARCV